MRFTGSGSNEFCQPQMGTTSKLYLRKAWTILSYCVCVKMGDNHQVLTSITKKPHVNYPVLTPNIRGVKDAIKAGAKEVALFTAVTDGFNYKNTNCSTKESMVRAKEILKTALDQNLRVRG